MMQVPGHGQPRRLYDAAQMLAQFERLTQRAGSGYVNFELVELTSDAQVFGFHDRGRGVVQLLNAGQVEAAQALARDLIARRRADPCADRNNAALVAEAVHRFGPAELAQAAGVPLEQAERAAAGILSQGLNELARGARRLLAPHVPVPEDPEARAAAIMRRVGPRPWSPAGDGHDLPPAA